MAKWTPKRRTGRWRVQCRRRSVVLREHSDLGTADQGRLLFAALVAEYAQSPDIDVELSERRNGAYWTHYYPVLLARAGHIVPPDGRKAEGAWAVYARGASVLAAVEKGLVRW